MVDRLVVIAAGPRATIQDRGRFGYAHLGVPPAGPIDRIAATAANAAVGNRDDAAVIEVTVGGMTVEAQGDMAVAVRGAPVRVSVDGRLHQGHRVDLRDQQRLSIAEGPTGVYSYLAVRGGIEVPPVLGSRATDTLTDIGPAILTDGAVVNIGEVVALPPQSGSNGQHRCQAVIPVLPGPHLDLLAPKTLDAFLGREWAVTQATDRIAARLDGEPLEAAGTGIDSEGLVDGAVQLPPDGKPIVFLANRPTTGGYPVIAVVKSDFIACVGQSRPGTSVRFTHA